MKGLQGKPTFPQEEETPALGWAHWPQIAAPQSLTGSLLQHPCSCRGWKETVPSSGDGLLCSIREVGHWAATRGPRRLLALKWDNLQGAGRSQGLSQVRPASLCAGVGSAEQEPCSALGHPGTATRPGEGCFWGRLRGSHGWGYPLQATRSALCTPPPCQGPCASSGQPEHTGVRRRPGQALDSCLPPQPHSGSAALGCRVWGWASEASLAAPSVLCTQNHELPRAMGHGAQACQARGPAEQAESKPRDGHRVTLQMLRVPEAPPEQHLRLPWGAPGSTRPCLSPGDGLPGSCQDTPTLPWGLAHILSRNVPHETGLHREDSSLREG